MTFTILINMHIYFKIYGCRETHMKEKDFIIATASTCDLDKDWLDRHHVPMISYTFEIDDLKNMIGS